MPATIRLDIVSAERELFSGECEMVVAPGAMGELGILPRHSPADHPAQAGGGPGDDARRRGAVLLRLRRDAGRSSPTW